MKHFIRSAFTFVILALPLVSIGCSARVGVGYRAYDPYRRDYHRWDDHETVFYNQWTTETHHDPHRDYRKLKRNDQNDYWKWRHDHDGH